MRTYAINYETSCDEEGCDNRAVALVGDLTVCRAHLKAYAPPAEDRETDLALDLSF